MKKFADLLKANILIFFGAILFLLFLNYLAGGGATLAIGIIATLVSIYYIVVGVLFIFIGKKLTPMTRKIFEVISVCLFALFIFVVSVIGMAETIANVADPNIRITVGPTAWIVMIFSVLASFALLGFYPVARFVNKNALINVCFLISALFCLSLLLEILFDANGFAINLGQIPFMYLALYVLFGIYLFGTLNNNPKEEPARLPEPKEEPAPEEVPAEEPAQE